MYLRTLLNGSVLALAFPVAAFATNPGDNWDHEGPIEDRYSASTVTVQGSTTVSSNGRELVFQSVDSEGEPFSGYVNADTGEVTAVGQNIVIHNVLTPAQQSVAQQRYAAAGPALVVVPILVGWGMCYINDQITKHRFIKACSDKGGTPVMEDSGICGFSASFRCDNIPPPPNPNPNPNPPTPGPGGDAFWYDNGFVLQPVHATSDFSVWTYDSDWGF